MPAGIVEFVRDAIEGEGPLRGLRQDWRWRTRGVGRRRGRVTCRFQPPVLREMLRAARRRAPSPSRSPTRVRRGRFRACSKRSAAEAADALLKAGRRSLRDLPRGRLGSRHGRTDLDRARPGAANPVDVDEPDRLDSTDPPIGSIGAARAADSSGPSRSCPFATDGPRCRSPRKCRVARSIGTPNDDDIRGPFRPTAATGGRGTSTRSCCDPQTALVLVDTGIGHLGPPRYEVTGRIDG